MAVAFEDVRAQKAANSKASNPLPMIAIVAPCDAAMIESDRTVVGSNTGMGLMLDLFDGDCCTNDTLSNDLDCDCPSVANMLLLRCAFNDVGSLSGTGGNVVLLSSNILLQASCRIQFSGGGAPRDPVATSAGLR